MKPPRTSLLQQRRQNFRSPDHYASHRIKAFRDVNLSGWLLALLVATVAFGIVLVTQA